MLYSRWKIGYFLRYLSWDMVYGGSVLGGELRLVEREGDVSSSVSCGLCRMERREIIGLVRSFLKR